MDQLLFFHCSAFLLLHSNPHQRAPGTRVARTTAAHAAAAHGARQSSRAAFSYLLMARRWHKHCTNGVAAWRRGELWASHRQACACTFRLSSAGAQRGVACMLGGVDNLFYLRYIAIINMVCVLGSVARCNSSQAATPLRHDAQLPANNDAPAPRADPTHAILRFCDSAALPYRARAFPQLPPSPTTTCLRHTDMPSTRSTATTHRRIARRGGCGRCMPAAWHHRSLGFLC